MSLEPSAVGAAEQTAKGVTRILVDAVLALDPCISYAADQGLSAPLAVRLSNPEFVNALAALDQIA